MSTPMVIRSKSVEEARLARKEFEDEKKREYQSQGLKYVRDTIGFKWEGAEYVTTICFHIEVLEPEAIRA